MPALGDEDVRRLDISMNNTLRMRCVQPVRHLDRQIQQLLQFYGLTSDQMFQRSAIQELHGDECVLVHFPNVINRADIRMV